MTHELSLTFEQRTHWTNLFLKQNGRVLLSYVDMLNAEFTDAEIKYSPNQNGPFDSITKFKSEDDKLRFVMKYL